MTFNPDNHNEHEEFKEKQNQKVIRVKKYEDDQGRLYHNIYFVKDTNINVAVDGVNTTYHGTPKITFREGNSVYGEEMILQFNIKDKIKEYNMNSDWQTVEQYFDFDDGIKFLEQALEYIKEVKKKNE